MPERKISITQTGYHKRREPQKQRKFLRLDDIKDGVSYRTMLETAWNTVDFPSLGMKNQDREIDLYPTQEIDGALLLTGMVGRTGENGQIKDIASQQVLQKDDSGTLTKQSLLRVAYFELDPDPIHGYLVIEKTPNGTLSGVAAKVIRAALEDIEPNFTASFIPLQNNEGWIETEAALKAIRIVRQKQAVTGDDVGELGMDTLRTNLEIKPEKGLGAFSGRFFKRVRDKKLNPHDLIGFPMPEEDEKESILLSLSDGKRSKLMDIDDLHGLTYQAVISTFGEASPSDKDFVRICREHLTDLLGPNSDR